MRHDDETQVEINAGNPYNSIISKDTNRSTTDGESEHLVNNDEVTDTTDNVNGNKDDNNASAVDVRQTTNQMMNEIKSPSQWPKNKSYIMYEEDGTWKEAFVLSYQPKRNGKNKEWLNIHVTGEEVPRSIAWKEVNAWKVVEKHHEKVLSTKSRQIVGSRCN